MVDHEERQGVWLDDDGVLHIVGRLSASRAIVVQSEDALPLSELDKEEIQRIEQAIGEALANKINGAIVRGVLGDWRLLAGVPGNAGDMLAFWWGDGDG